MRTICRALFSRAALVLFAGCMLPLCAARAGQSVQDAVADLTSGAWHQESAEAGHADVFKQDGDFTYGIVSPDGTFTELPGYGGMWIVTGSTVEMSYLQWPERHDIYNLPITPAKTAGVDEHGKPISMERLSKPVTTVAVASKANRGSAQGISPEQQQRASGIVKTYQDSILFVTGSEAAGGAFIVTAGTANFLFTNAHVAAGIKDASFTALDGTVMHGTGPKVAVGEDLFLMKVTTSSTGFQIMHEVQKNISVGDPVVVLGNAEGAGVVNTLMGKIVGIGTDLVEVDAPFVPGNSGSPIIDLKSGSVIGVATYMVFDPYGGGGFGMGSQKVRRFGYRLDSVKSWQPVDWTGFRAQAASMEAIQKRTMQIAMGLMSMSYNQGKPTPGGAQDINDALRAWRAIIKRDGKWPQKETASETLAAVLKTACESDMKNADSEMTYDYFQRMLKEQKTARDQMEAAIWPTIKAAY
jgi:S1-C subfamily serine protease